EGIIDKFKDKDKISILQQLRYDLQEEHNAYSIAQKYAPENEDFTKFNFLEKKEIATQKLKDVFKQIRGKE
ncbi:hypothetical protein IJZ97_02310, partial [bacterium]|nr:hypothetical protein [bacterium]